jgi:hypothetical protein
MNSKQESEKKDENKKKDILMKDVLKPTPYTSGFKELELFKSQLTSFFSYNENTQKEMYMITKQFLRRHAF